MSIDILVLFLNIPFSFISVPEHYCINNRRLLLQQATRGDQVYLTSAYLQINRTKINVLNIPIALNEIIQKGEAHKIIYYLPRLLIVTVNRLLIVLN